MQRKLYRLVATPLIGMMFLLFPAALSAQSFWLERGPGKNFLVEIFKPDIHRGVYNGLSYPVDYSLETVALFFSLRRPIGSKTFLVVELPFAHATFDTKIEDEFSSYRHSGYSNTIGNPYLGLARGSLNSRFSTEIGLRLPLAKTDNNYASQVGMAADVDRLEAFDDYVALRAMINFRTKRTKGLMFRARIGAMILRDLDHLRDHYFAVPLNLMIGYQTARFNVGANNVIWVGFLRQYRSRIRTAYNRGNNFSARAEGGGGLTASFKFGNLRPGIYIGSSLGLNLNIQR